MVETQFAIEFHSRNFRWIKTDGLERVNDEMIRTSTIHNLKKIHKHMNNNVLKKMLNEIRMLKQTQEVSMDILKEWKDLLVYKDDKIVDILF